MKTNDKLPKENDYSLAYSSYNTQQDERDHGVLSMTGEETILLLRSNWVVNEDEKASEIQLLLPFNILPINYFVIKIVARNTTGKTLGRNLFASYYSRVAWLSGRQERRQLYYLRQV